MLHGCLVFTFCSKIEIAYQEAVALKRQEELIREEEAAWMAETELKTKRGASEKEKKSKKKQVFCLDFLELFRITNYWTIGLVLSFNQKLVYKNVLVIVFYGSEI